MYCIGDEKVMYRPDKGEVVTSFTAAFSEMHTQPTFRVSSLVIMQQGALRSVQMNLFAGHFYTQGKIGAWVERYVQSQTYRAAIRSLTYAHRDAMIHQFYKTYEGAWRKVYRGVAGCPP